MGAKEQAEQAVQDALKLIDKAGLDGGGLKTMLEQVKAEQDKLAVLLEQARVSLDQVKRISEQNKLRESEHNTLVKRELDELSKWKAHLDMREGRLKLKERKYG